MSCCMHYRLTYSSSSRSVVTIYALHYFEITLFVRDLASKYSGVGDSWFMSTLDVIAHNT